MLDIYLGLLIVLGLSAGTFWLGLRLVRRHYRMAALSAILAGLLLLVFGTLFYGQLRLSHLIPLSNVIVLGNLSPLGAGFLIGVLMGRNTIPMWRRGMVSVILCGVALFSLFNPLFGSLPSATNTWSDGVCMQTSDVSCSACAAATLLKCHDIETDEAEMTALCLTTHKGTTPLGLFRGLKIKARDAGWNVQVVRCDVDTVRELAYYPMLLRVGLERDGDVDAIYEDQFGWSPGIGHAVVLYGFTEDGKVWIGDPSIGREQWSVEDFRELWRGEGLRLTHVASQR